MKKNATRLLALLLACAVMLGLAACASGDAPEPTEGKTVIRVPEPVKYEKCTELGTPLADVRVRRALAHAVDMDTVIEALYWETGKASGGWDYDPELAKALLAEAGWPSEYVLDVVYYQTDPQIEDMLKVILSYWEAVGVRAEVRKLEADVEQALWTAPDDPEGDSAVQWDLAVCAVTDVTEAEFFSRFASDAPDNSHTPKIDGLDEAVAAGSTEEIQKLLSENVSYIPLLTQNGFVCISDHLSAGSMETGNDRFRDILNWTTDREDETLYLAGAPEEAQLCPVAEPAAVYQELVFDRLVDADGEGRIAESCTVSGDGKSVEFVLPEDLIWHDGEPLTAEDVKFTFELYLRCPDLEPEFAEMLEKLEGAEAFTEGDADECAGITVEENTVTFCFDEETEELLSEFSRWPVLPKHKLKNVKPAKLLTNKFWKNPVGSGPFRVTELVPGSVCTLERWDGYRQTGEGNISQIRMNSSDENLAVLAARDLLDYGWGISTDDGAYIAGLEHMEVAAVEDACRVCFFINQFPHESYFTPEEATEPTE